MSDISHKLHDLLVREAHLRLSREQLLPVLAEKEKELQAIGATKPRMLAFIAKDKRAAWQAQFEEAQSAVKLLRTGVQQLENVGLHLGKMLRDEIEDLLRASCLEYSQGLAAAQQKEDWARCLERFGQRLHEFIQAVGNARNMACTGYTRATNMYSQQAVEGFMLAITAGEKVEAEVRFANRLAELQAQMFKDSGFGDLPSLPRLREVNYAVWVTSISGTSLAEAQVQFDALIADTKELHETGLTGLLAQAQLAEESQDTAVNNFLEAAWEQLRGDIAPLINPEETEENVAETEKMIVEAARAGVLGRLSTPADEVHHFGVPVPETT